eukprot:gene57389-biopygen103968
MVAWDGTGRDATGWYGVGWSCVGWGGIRIRILCPNVPYCRLCAPHDAPASATSAGGSSVVVGATVLVREQFTSDNAGDDKRALLKGQLGVVKDVHDAGHVQVDFTDHPKFQWVKTCNFEHVIFTAPDGAADASRRLRRPRRRGAGDFGRHASAPRAPPRRCTLKKFNFFRIPNPFNQFKFFNSLNRLHQYISPAVAATPTVPAVLPGGQRYLESPGRRGRPGRKDDVRSLGAAAAAPARRRVGAAAAPVVGSVATVRAEFTSISKSGGVS